jgi:DNA-binding transcriptional LysR family regulator
LFELLMSSPRAPLDIGCDVSKGIAYPPSAAERFLMSRLVAWDDQRAFLAVIEEGSLSAAARRMGVSQPTMRARLDALERGLGVVLFTRSMRGLVPTDQARALIGPARMMASASETFIRTASGPVDRVAGVVRLSVPDVVGVELLSPMLVGLRRRHPDLIVEMVLSNTSANLLEQEVDIAVRMHRPTQEALVAREVPSIPIGLFAHADYLAARGTPGSIGELDRHDIIGPDRSVADLDFASGLLQGLARTRYVVRTDSHPAQLAAARAGLGIAVIHLAIGLRDDRLRRVLPDLEMPPLRTWIVTHESLRAAPRVRSVFDHLVVEFEAYAHPRAVMAPGGHDPDH